jgi:hypothetical protein
MVIAMRLQKLVHIRQNFPDRRLPDIPAAVRQAMEAAEWTKAVKPGGRIAVGVGSRGISNIATIALAVVDFWKSRGAKPFIIPVMGSHGAATAEGQADVLAHYGIIEETMGVPVVSSLDVVPLGTTPEGVEVLMSRDALEADGVMLCSRVKWHTDFEGKIESGIHKMMAIGLGNGMAPSATTPGASGSVSSRSFAVSARLSWARARCWGDWPSSRMPTTTPPKCTPSAQRASSRGRKSYWPASSPGKPTFRFLRSMC